MAVPFQDSNNDDHGTLGSSLGSSLFMETHMS